MLRHLSSEKSVEGFEGHFGVISDTAHGIFQVFRIAREGQPGPVRHAHNLRFEPMVRGGYLGIRIRLNTQRPGLLGVNLLHGFFQFVVAFKGPPGAISEQTVDTGTDVDYRSFNRRDDAAVEGSALTVFVIVGRY